MYNERVRRYTTLEVRVRTTLWTTSGALHQTKGTNGSHTCRERVSSVRSYPWAIKGQAFLFLTHKHTCCNTLKAILLSSLNWSRARTWTSITTVSQISRWIPAIHHLEWVRDTIPHRTQILLFSGFRNYDNVYTRSAVFISCYTSML